MKTIGVHCYYVGPNAAMRNRRATILGVVRGRRTDASLYMERDDREFEHDPVLADEMVQVHIAESAAPTLVRAAE